MSERPAGPPGTPQSQLDGTSHAALPTSGPPVKGLHFDALAGIHPADQGGVRFDGVDVYRHLDEFRTVLGYVPQDDIIYDELPLERTLRYAAALRLSGASFDRTTAEGQLADLERCPSLALGLS